MGEIKELEIMVSSQNTEISRLNTVIVRLHTEIEESNRQQQEEVSATNHEY